MPKNKCRHKRNMNKKDNMTPQKEHNNASILVFEFEEIHEMP